MFACSARALLVRGCASRGAAAAAGTVGRQAASSNTFAASAATVSNTCRSLVSNGAAAFRQQQQKSAAQTQQLMQTLPRRTFHSSKAALQGSAPAAETSPGIVASILAFPRAQPFAFNIMIATVKTSIADGITQVAIEQKSEIDWKRNAVFVVFGAVYLGGFQYWLQVNMFKKWFPHMERFANQSFAAKLKDTAGLIDTGKQVLFDVFIHLPLMYFPAFYATKESVMGTSWSPVDWVKDGCTKYYNNFQKDFTAMFSLWFPADCVIFAVPLWLRLPVRHVVSLGWTSYLSFLRGSKQDGKTAAAVAQE